MYIKIKHSYNVGDLLACKDKYGICLLDRNLKLVGVLDYCDDWFTKKVQYYDYDKDRKRLRAECIYDYFAYFNIFPNIQDNFRETRIEHDEKYILESTKTMIINHPKTSKVFYDTFSLEDQLLLILMYQKLCVSIDTDVARTITKMILEFTRTDISCYKECFI